MVAGEILKLKVRTKCALGLFLLQILYRPDHLYRLRLKTPVIARNQAITAYPCVTKLRNQVSHEAVVVGGTPAFTIYFVDPALQPTGLPLGKLTFLSAVSDGSVQLSSKWTLVVRPHSIVTGTSTQQ